MSRNVEDGARGRFSRPLLAGHLSGGLVRSCTVVALASWLFACGGDSPVDPDPGPDPDPDPVPAALTVLDLPSTAVVGEVLELRVRVDDDAGDAMQGVSVDLAVVEGGGSVAPARVTTGAGGLASFQWTLGTVPGQQRLSVAAGNVEAGAALHADRLRIQRLVVVQRPDAEAPAGWTFEDPVTVRAVDQNDRPLPGQTVEWTVETGGGSVSATSTVTDAEGLASTTWSLGPVEGEQTLRVSATDGNATVALVLSVTTFTGVRIRAELVTFRQGRPVDRTLEAWGGDGGPYTWSVADGVLPAGVSLSTDGVLSGTPEEVGAFGFTLGVTDGSGASGQRAYDLSVCEAALRLGIGERRVVEAPDACGLLVAPAVGETYRLALMARGPAEAPWIQEVPGDLLLRIGPEELAAEPPAGPGARTPRPVRVLGAPPAQVVPEPIAVAERKLFERLRNVPRPVLGPPRTPALAEAPPAPPTERSFLVGTPEGATTVQATLRGASERVLYYQDDGDPDPGEAADVEAALAWFDTHGWPVIEGAFGGYGPEGTTSMFTGEEGAPRSVPVGDLDENGRAIVLEVRDDLLFGAVGLARGCDLLPRPEHAADEGFSCPESNEAEIVYVAGPGTTLMTHELKHVSSLTWFLYGDRGPNPSWIEEGTAVVASELASRRAGGVTPGERVVASQVFAGGDYRSDDTYFYWAAPFSAYRYLAAAPASGLKGDPSPNPGGSTFYGSSWFLHRWILDVFGGGDPTALMKRLNTEGGGEANIEAVTGRPMAELVVDWLHATLVDDVPAARATTPHRYLSYDFAGIVGAHPSAPREWPGFVADADLARGTWLLETWRTSANLFQLRATGSEELLVRVESGDGGPVPLEEDVVLVLVRVE